MKGRIRLKIYFEAEADKSFRWLTGEELDREKGMEFQGR